MRTLMKFIALAAFAGVFGCSLHPIQDTVTDLPTHAIIQKIRCEAKEAVDSVYWGDHVGVKSLYGGKILASEKKQYEAATKRLEASQRELDDVNAEAGRIKDRRARLQARDGLNRLRWEKAKDDTANGALDVDGLEKEKKAVEAENLRLASSIIQYRIDVLASNAKVVARGKAVKDLEKRRNLEFRDHMNFLKQRMAYQVQFKVTEKNTGKANASLKIPILLGSVTIDQINGGDDRERTGDRNVRVAAGFGDLLTTVCVPPPVGGGSVSRYPIEGNIGLAEVIQQYLEIAVGKTKAEFQKEKGVDSYTDKITFKTTMSGGVTPKITITNAAGHTFTGSLDATGSRTDEHVVFVNLSLEEDETKAAIEADKITKVQIVTEQF